MVSLITSHSEQLDWQSGVEETQSMARDGEGMARGLGAGGMLKPNSPIMSLTDTESTGEFLSCSLVWLYTQEWNHRVSSYKQQEAKKHPDISSTPLIPNPSLDLTPCDNVQRDGREPKWCV